MACVFDAEWFKSDGPPGVLVPRILSLAAKNKGAALKRSNLVPKTPSKLRHRPRRLRATNCTDRNPLLGPWIATDNCDTLQSTRKSQPLVGRMAAAPQAAVEEHDGRIESKTNRLTSSLAVKSLPKSDVYLNGSSSDDLDLPGNTERAIQEQLKSDMSQSLAPRAEPRGELESGDSSQKNSSSEDGRGNCFDVEHIIGRRVRRGRKARRGRRSWQDYEYLVKWEGYDSDANSWVPSQKFKDKTCLKKYNAQY